VADLFSAAWLSVTRHRLRSLLAMAGVAVGVCALTSIMSVEQAWRRAVTAFFAPLDLETVRVTIPGWVSRGRVTQFRKAELDQIEVEAIVRHCPAVSAATLVTSRTLYAESKDGGLDLTTYAVAADFTATLPDEVQEGRLFTAEEVAQRAPLCVLSLNARLSLFGDGPPLGRYLRVSGQRFQVIGVIAGNRHAGFETRAIYLPATWTRATLQTRFWDSPATDGFVRTPEPKAAVGQIEQVMRQRIGGDGSQSFTHSLWQVREVALHARDRATIYSALAGLCALLAAGIGIASLLFVSVAERSQEIGVHRALGASRARIYGEYLLASAMLSGGGALIGAIGGIPAAAAGAFTTRWQPVLDPLAGEFLTAGQLPKLSEIALSVSWEAMALAAVLALLAGATAALAPASEAASLSPALAIARRAGTQRGTRQVLTSLQVAFGVVVLVVLTSYYALLDNEERAEARRGLGQDTVSAIADPIAAMREPVEQRYINACNDALAEVFSNPRAIVRLRQQTPLLTDVVASASLDLTLSRAGRVCRGLVFATSDPSGDQLASAGTAGKRAVEAFGAGDQVAVINPQTKDALFGKQEPVGQQFVIAGRKFTVAAVRPNPPGSNGEFVWVPIAQYKSLRVRARSDWSPFDSPRVEGRPVDPRRYAEALAQLRDALLPMLPKEYRKGILLSEQIPETTKQFIFQSKAIAARGAVGALAVLLVALIGLANMLLVSVHDDLRETGVRRALGATRPDVFLHFLSQGVLLSALGAAAGLAIGAAVCGATRSWAGMPLTVSAFWAAAGALATVLAGMVTSVAPALVAARVHPVEALRYE